MSTSLTDACAPVVAGDAFVTLTPGQRRIINDARQVATADAAELMDGIANPRGDLALTYGVAFGTSQYTVRELLSVIDTLTGGAA